VISLPIDSHIWSIVEAVDSRRCAVIIAPPGAGKTTRVPPALLDAGKLILLQPRRVAARSLARRIASEQGWEVGREIGWQIRFERRFTRETRLLVATEGILNARLQSDPLLEEFATVVLDEFHERSVDLDLAIAFLRQAREARPDLRVVVMSATLAADRVAAWLGAPVIEVETRKFPVEIEHQPGVSAADAVRRTLSSTRGHVLVFLPGAREIDDTVAALRTADAEVLPLHGRLDADQQDRALAPSSRRKVIVATNIAETSLTVEGVTTVIDSGLHRVLRYDAARAIDALVTERVPRDSAEQRAGRGGRTGPGRAIRLWDRNDILREHREPEIARVDLAPVVLDVLAWGADPRTFGWFDPPPDSAIEQAVTLLERLGAVADGKLTADGRLLARLPVHPRIGRILLSTGAPPETVALCATVTGEPVAELRAAAARVIPVTGRDDERRLRHAVFEAYGDRLARRRGQGWVMASGFGARLGPGVHTSAEWIVALDAAVTTRGGVTEALIRSALEVDPEWVVATHRDSAITVEGDKARRVERDWYDAILMAERRVPLPPEEEYALLEERRVGRLRELEAGAEPRPGEEETVQAIRRARISPSAPTHLTLPSGRRGRLDYRADGSIVLEAKLQELFGLAETPRIGATAVTVVLLAPNGRPVQTTQDLRSFWERGYPEVRRELRGRYPKHPWPEDPWTAVATHLSKRRK
jgi:ATP-dependent helicase HrpB